MEKRIVPFIVLSSIILFGTMWVRSKVDPPPVEDPAEGEVIDEGEGQVADADLPGENGEGDAPDADAPAEPDDQQPALEPAEAPPGELPDEPEQRYTLGSLSESQPYRMLVTFNNRGAAIERIELTSHRYRDLETNGGYLGSLALTDAEQGGAVVNVVGPGTPAALATPVEGATETGLAVGVITQIDDTNITYADDVLRALAGTKPRQQVTIQLERSEGGQPRTITYEAKLHFQPLQLLRPEEEIRPVIDDEHPRSFQMTLSVLGNRELSEMADELPGINSAYTSNWVGESIDTAEGPAVEFRLPIVGKTAAGEAVNLELVRRYRLAKGEVDTGEISKGDPLEPAYHLIMEVEIRNLGANPLLLGYRLRGPTGMPLEGWWYAYKVHPTKWGVAGVRDLFYRSGDGQHHMIRLAEVLKQFERAEEAEEEGRPPENAMVNLRLSDSDTDQLDYVGVDNQYFAVALLADPPEEGEAPAGYDFSSAKGMIVGEVDPLRGTRSDVSFQLDSKPQQLQPGETLSQRYRIFAGPEDPPLMSKYGLNDVVVYGWFAVVARPMQSILHFFYGIVHNYGLAIILLTVLVRGCLFPLGRKVAPNARKMQELAPEMKAIAEKYKDDMQKRGDAQRELFRAHNYNPFGGCLLMFLQLPIFIGLYRALSVDIQLRQAPLIPGIHWASNLAGPDMLFRWDSYMGNLPLIGGMFVEGGMLGPYFNLLPMITVVLFLVQQKLFTPPPTDEQQALQQKMMSFMTLFIGIMFFRVPAGLCLYFIASSLWGIGERKLLPKPTPPAGGETAPATVAARPANSSSNRGSQREQTKRRKGKKRR